MTSKTSHSVKHTTLANSQGNISQKVVVNVGTVGKARRAKKKPQPVPQPVPHASLGEAKDPISDPRLQQIRASRMRALANLNSIQAAGGNPMQESMVRGQLRSITEQLIDYGRRQNELGRDITQQIGDLNSEFEGLRMRVGAPQKVLERVNAQITMKTPMNDRLLDAITNVESAITRAGGTLGKPSLGVSSSSSVPLGRMSTAYGGQKTTFPPQENQLEFSKNLDGISDAIVESLKGVYSDEQMKDIVDRGRDRAMLYGHTTRFRDSDNNKLAGFFEEAYQGTPLPPQTPPLPARQSSLGTPTSSVATPIGRPVAPIARETMEEVMENLQRAGVPRPAMSNERFLEHSQSYIESRVADGFVDEPSKAQLKNKKVSIKKRIDKLKEEFPDESDDFIKERLEKYIRDNLRWN